MQEESKSRFDPHRVAVLYYFGDLTYWHLPQIAADAIERGHDGHALRGLAGLTNPVQSDIRRYEVDAAFREMGVATPISKEEARLILAAESATKAIRGDSNVFDEATHIRIHLCELKDPPQPLRRIVNVSNEARNAQRSEWGKLEQELTDAMSEFLRSRK